MTDIGPVSPKPHPALNYLQLERSSAFLFNRGFWELLKC